jgi:AraC family transcriptional regulator
MAIERTAAETLDRHIPGELVVGSAGGAWKDVIAQIFSRQRLNEAILVPAVAEPLIVWVLSGTAVVEEREVNGTWSANEVKVGDFFLTNSAAPYELRWRETGQASFQVMHLYLGLPLLDRATKDVLGQAAYRPSFREVSGEKDQQLSMLLEQFRQELTNQREPSSLLVQGVAQCLAVHILRHYRAENDEVARRARALPAFKLRRVTEFMRDRLSDDFNLKRLAREAGMSEFHFSRMFKQATTFSPSQFFIRLRMTEAKRLLRETDRSVIDIGLDVGYSSPSHFAQVFRREAGVSPTDYRAG